MMRRSFLRWLLDRFPPYQRTTAVNDPARPMSRSTATSVGVSAGALAVAASLASPALAMPLKIVAETRYDIVAYAGDNEENRARGIKPGDVLFRDTCHNRVVTAGLNKLLDATFKTGLASPLWYVGVCSPSVTDGAITSGAAVLTSASNPFSSGDAGRSIIVRGAGSAGADLVTTILSYTNAGSVTLASNAGTTVTAAGVIWEARAADTMSSHSPWVESTAYSNATRPAFTPGSISGGSVDNSASQASFTINTNNTIVGGLFLADNNTVGGTSGTLYGMAPFSVSFRQLNNGDTLAVTATLTQSST